ncbi:Kelch repeat-containing protein [Amycolatopsis balhimycina]|nr:kelch-like protein [Amycolatopsis balhimycina]
MSKQWKDRPPLHTGRFAHAAATTHGHIYVIGGADANVALNSVEFRRIHGDSEWHEVAPMPTARGNHGVGVVDGMIYAVGGIIEGDHGTDVVERYDPFSDRWTTAPPLPSPRTVTSAAGLGGLLYVAGGVIDENDTDEHATDSVLVFDPREERWSPVASMLSPRARHRLVAAGGHLYSIGGLRSFFQEAFSTVERYAPKSDTWEAVRSMHQPRALPGATVLGGDDGDRIVVVGGGPGPFQDRLSRHRTTEIYDLRTGKWHLLSTLLPRGRSSLAAAPESENTVLAISGSTTVDRVPTLTPDVLALKLPAA